MSLPFRIRRRILAAAGTSRHSVGTFCRPALAWEQARVLHLSYRFPPTLPLTPLAVIALWSGNPGPITCLTYIRIVSRAGSRIFAPSSLLSARLARQVALRVYLFRV